MSSWNVFKINLFPLTVTFVRFEHSQHSMYCKTSGNDSIYIIMSRWIYNILLIYGVIALVTPQQWLPKCSQVKRNRLQSSSFRGD